MRVAWVENPKVGIDEVRAALPRNYKACMHGMAIMIYGHDVAGWTLDGYVVPRLASGLIFARIDESDVEF